MTARADSPPTRLAWGHGMMVGFVMLGSYVLTVALLQLRPFVPVGPMGMGIWLSRWIAEAPQQRLHWGALWAIAIGVAFALIQLAWMHR